MRILVISALLATAISCASVPPSPPSTSPVEKGLEREPRIRAMAFSRDRSTFWYAVGDDRCEVRALAVEARTERTAFSMSRCPSSIRVLDDESLILSDGPGFGIWKRADGSDVIPGEGIPAAAGASNYVTVAESRLLWRRGAETRDLGSLEPVRALRFLPESGDLLLTRRSGDGERIVRVTASGENDVTPAFSAIDSMDVAPRGDEIVFSARRDRGFDVAIASPDGKTVNWVAPDPADELSVTWAPRGNKISYLIRGLDATLVRTVHVPTSAQLTFDLPHKTVRGLAWEPRAERFAMSLEGPVTSAHVDWIEYAGDRREPLVAPRARLNREPESVAFGAGSGLLLPPSAIRYGEKRPLFIELTDEPWAWSPELKDLESLGGAILRVPVASWGDGAPLATFRGDLKWVDPEAVVVIDPASRLSSEAVARLGKGETHVTLGTKQAPGRFFSTRELDGGGSAVSAENWQGAMAWLRGRFAAKR